MTIVSASRLRPIHFSRGRTIQKDVGTAGSKDINVAFKDLTELNRKIFDKGKDIAWLPLDKAKEKIDLAAETNPADGISLIDQEDKFGNTFLHYVIDPNKYNLDYDKSSTSRESKYQDLVNHVLNQNPNVNIKGNDGDRPLAIAIDFAHAAMKQGYKELDKVIQDAVVSLLEKGAFVKKADLKALPKEEKGTKELRDQVKEYYKQQRSSFFAKVVALFK